MEEKTKYLVKEISSSFKKSAVDFFLLGIKDFHNIRKNELSNYQTSVANLCISIELLFKSTIAEKSLRDLYKNLPQEFQIYLLKPEIIPDASAFRKLSIDLKSSVYKTLEFNECVSLFYLFYSDEKQKYRPYLSLLSNIRNASIHSFLPKFQLYDLLKVAYICIDIFYFILGENNLYLNKDIKDDNIKFMKEYNNDRVERVRKSIYTAREKAKKLDHTDSMISVDGWDIYIGTCPVCESDVPLYGYTEPRYEGEDSYLDYFADSLECEECGLKLDDFEELKLAGVQIHYDRNESIYEYLKDFPPILDMD
ncbi:MAG TPA: hypothetical protein PLT92_13950 [Ignavibacteriaceae bacterium]|nr:hypothetical protein [Ignavibacteriaceae bacterium]